MLFIRENFHVFFCLYNVWIISIITLLGEPDDIVELWVILVHVLAWVLDNIAELWVFYQYTLFGGGFSLRHYSLPQAFDELILLFRAHLHLEQFVEVVFQFLHFLEFWVLILLLLLGSLIFF